MMRPILLLLLSSGTGVAAQGLRAHRSLQMSLAEDPEPAQAVPEAAAAAPMSAAAAFGLSLPAAAPVAAAAAAPSVVSRSMTETTAVLAEAPLPVAVAAPVAPAPVVAAAPVAPAAPVAAVAAPLPAATSAIDQWAAAVAKKTTDQALLTMFDIAGNLKKVSQSIRPSQYNER